MDRNGLRQNYAMQNYAMLDCRCICPTVLRPTVLRRIFRSFSAALNLSLILGGAGAKLEDMAAAYTAFARHGKAGKLRLQPDDPLLERPLMSIRCLNGL